MESRKAAVCTGDSGAGESLLEDGRSSDQVSFFLEFVQLGMPLQDAEVGFQRVDLVDTDIQIFLGRGATRFALAQWVDLTADL